MSTVAELTKTQNFHQEILSLGDTQSQLRKIENKVADLISDDKWVGGMALKSEVASLSIALQQAASPADYDALLLGRFSERIGCRQGMLAIATPSWAFDVVARYGAAPADRSKAHYDMNEGVVGQCARGAVNFVSKPIDPEQVSAAVKSALAPS